MKVTRESICDGVGGAREVVIARHVAVVALVNTKQAEKMGRHLPGGGAAFALPEEGVEVVGFTDDGTLSDVETLGDGFQVQEGTRQFEIRVGDGTVWVGGSDKLVDDIGGPAKAPEHWLVTIS